MKKITMDEYEAAIAKIATTTPTTERGTRWLEVDITQLRNQLQQGGMGGLACKLKNLLLELHLEPKFITEYYTKVELWNSRILNTLFSSQLSTDITSEFIVSSFLATGYHKAISPERLFPLINLFAHKSDRAVFSAITDLDYEGWIEEKRLPNFQELAGISSDTLNTEEILVDMDCYESLSHLINCDYHYLTEAETAALRYCIGILPPCNPMGNNGFIQRATTEAYSALLIEASTATNKISDTLVTLRVKQVCDWWGLNYRDMHTVFGHVADWLLCTPLITTSGERVERINMPYSSEAVIRVSLSFEVGDDEVDGNFHYTSSEPLPATVRLPFKITGNYLTVTRPRNFTTIKDGVEVPDKEFDLIEENVKHLAIKMGLLDVLWVTTIRSRK